MTELKTSHAEDLLYGEFARAVRLIGQAAASSVLAANEAVGLLTASHEADGIAMGQANVPAEMDERGASAHSRWLGELYEHLYEAQRICTEVHREVALKCSTRHHDMRSVVASTPAMEIPERP